jgi:chromosome segregation protein
MKLKKMEIVGFKSFVDKASIEFPEGISAIVGPNGCGKSNLVDAIRWVMGEQSVKQLRGKAMNDLIFAGTNGKPPLNMAEVSLTLANDNGSAPEELKDFTEIMLTRRLFRSGESAYFLNKRPCRLKDIHNIFLGSGMGAKSFSVIQQGNIGAITDAGPDDRRHFIEEAAGVTRYKNRKKEALRKLAQTRQNLLRVEDIVGEVKRQMNGLKRQANKAERYKAIQKQIQTLDVVLGLRQYQDYSRQINQYRQLLKELKDADLQHTAKIRQLDVAVEDIKIKRWQKNEEITSQKNKMHDIQRALDRLENDLLHLHNSVKNLAEEINSFKVSREDLSAKTSRIHTEIEQTHKDIESLQAQIVQTQSELDQEQSASKQLRDKQNRLQEEVEAHKSRLMKLVAQEARHNNIYQTAANNKDNIKRRLKRIDEEVVLSRQEVQALSSQEMATTSELKKLQDECANQSRKIDSMKQKLASAHHQLNDKIKEVQTIEMNRNKLHSRYAALKKMEDNFEWYKDGVRAIMKHHLPLMADDSSDPSNARTNKTGLKGIIGMMSDIIEPAPEYETAVEAVLGDVLQYIIVEDQTAGIKAVDYLQLESAGRSGFIPVSTLSPYIPVENDSTHTHQRLLNHITVKPGFEHIAEAMLGNIIAVASIDEAIALWNANGLTHTFVTSKGEVLSHQGIITGGSSDTLPGILAKKHELKRLSQELDHVKQGLTEGRQALRLLEDQVRDIEQQLQKEIAENNQLHLEETALEKELYKISEDLKHARRRHDISRLEQENLQGEASDIDGEIQTYGQVIQEMALEIEETQKTVAVSTHDIESITSQLEAYNQKVVDLRLQRTALNAKLENCQNTARRLQTFQSDSQKQLQELFQEIQRKTHRHDQYQQQIGEKKLQLTDLKVKLEEIDKSLDASEQEYANIAARLKNNDEEIAKIQTRREQVSQKIRSVELEHSQLSIKRESVENRLREYYHQDIADLQTQFGDQSQELDQGMDQIEQELILLRQKISKLGDVNLGAIKEFEELNQRFDFLRTQQDDLHQAIEDLEKVIRKINRISQKKFMKTFELINEKLGEVFPSLFDGGTAKLMLTEPSKPLETGVELMIHLPGKKLTRLSLLSGGEKALSAIAFIFAIFLIKPASFCLLDEIDAPLDDANILRFNELLQIIGKKSQIVMVTHNKRSMEFAETLFGVTMEKKGVSKLVSVNLTTSDESVYPNAA